MAQIVVYHVSDGEIVAWHWNYDELVGKPNVFSDEPVPWKEDPTQYSKADRENLQKVIKGHTLSGIQYALKAMNLAKASKL